MEGAAAAAAAPNNNDAVLREMRATLARIESRLDAECKRSEERFRAIQKRLGDTGSFYEQHEGIKYKHALLEQARAALESGGRISEKEVDHLWAAVSADGKVSGLERRTLQFIRDSDDFRLTDRATRRLDAHLAGKD